MSCTLSWIDLSKVTVSKNDVDAVRATLKENGFAIVQMRRFFADVVLKEFDGKRYRRWYLKNTLDYYLLDSKMIKPHNGGGYPIDDESEAAIEAYCEGRGPSVVP